MAAGLKAPTVVRAWTLRVRCGDEQATEESCAGHFQAPRRIYQRGWKASPTRSFIALPGREEARLAIRGVIFDFGGVINNMRWDVARDLEDEHGLERGTITRTLYDSEDWREVEGGGGASAEWRGAAHGRRG